MTLWALVVVSVARLACCRAGITHWQSPNFFAYYPANSSFPGMLGDMLSSMFNVIGFSWISSPACTELERVRKPSLPSCSIDSMARAPHAARCTRNG